MFPRLLHKLRVDYLDSIRWLSNWIPATELPGEVNRVASEKLMRERCDLKSRKSFGSGQFLKFIALIDTVIVTHGN
jgi:hypothetical protein